MLLGTSCQNEEIVSRTEGQEFSLTLDMGAKSRTMMGENGAVWGDNEALYVVGDGGKSYGTLTMVWKSEDGKSAMFSGKITGDAGKLEHMVYPVPTTDNKIQMNAMDGSSHNAPMVGKIEDGEVTGLGYQGGLVKLDFSSAAVGESFTVKATDNAGVSIVGGYYTFDPVNGTLTYTETTGDVLEISNVPSDGIVWVPVDSDAPKGTPETITVSVTDEFGTTISGDVNISQGGAAAEDGNVFPSMTYNENTGLAPTKSETVNDADYLKEAFTNGGQYQLTQDITLTEALSLPEDKSLYLDLNGKTITLDGSNAEEVVEIKNYGTLNIFNGKIEAANHENSRRCIYNYGTMTIGMEGGSQPVEFVQRYNMKGAAINNEGNMTIKNATVNAVYYSIWNSGENAEIVVNSGTYTTTNDVEVRDTWAYAVNNINGAKMTINGGSFTGNHGVVAATTGAEVTLNDGTFNCTATYTGNSDWTLYAGDQAYLEYNDDCTLTHAYKTKYESTCVENGGKIYVAVNNQNQLSEVIKSKHDRIILEAGEYELSTLTWKTVDLIGRHRTRCVAKISKSFYGQDLRVGLQNMTIEVPTGLAYTEQEFAYIHRLGQLNVEKCTINGSLRLNVSYAEIDGCEFNVGTAGGFDGYGLYYYGNNNSTIKVLNSNFNTVSKGIVIYNEGPVVYNLEVSGCGFKATTPADKAAIQMHTEYGISGSVTITETTATGFANINNGLWNELNNDNKTKTTKFNITVDGKQVQTAE